MGKPTSAAVEAGIDLIEEMYRLGRTPKGQSATSRLIEGKTKLTATEYTENVGAFFDLYSEKDLHRLTTQARGRQFKLGKSTIFKLLRVKDPQQRRSIQTQMIRERWSLRELKAHLGKTYGVQTFGGRRTSPKSFQHGAFEAKQALHLATQMLRSTIPLTGPTKHNAATKKEVEQLFRDALGYIKQIAEIATHQLNLPAPGETAKTPVPLSKGLRDRLRKISEIAAMGGKPAAPPQQRSPAGRRNGRRRPRRLLSFERF